MNEVVIKGSLKIELINTENGQAIRTAFYTGAGSDMSFSCWVKVSELSGNIKRRVSSESLAAQEACMIGLTSFSDNVASLLMQQEKEELNTFGIGE